MENTQTQTETSTQTTSWKIDASHSNIKFITRHMVISKVTGNFGEFDASMTTKGDDFVTAQVEFEAKIASINTGNEQRDTHLKSDDFFNAEQFPTLKFKSTKIECTGPEEYKMTGDMTIRDITKSLTFDVEFGGIVKDPWGMERAGFHIHGKINRFDFNLKWNALIETGGAVVAENIVIDCDVEMIKQQGA